MSLSYEVHNIVSLVCENNERQQMSHRISKSMCVKLRQCDIYNVDTICCQLVSNSIVFIDYIKDIKYTSKYCTRNI